MIVTFWMGARTKVLTKTVEQLPSKPPESPASLLPGAFDTRGMDFKLNNSTKIKKNIKTVQGHH